MGNISYVHGLGTIPLLGETIGENLRNTVQKYPDQDALIVYEQNYRVTYRTFWQQVEAVAKGLLAFGLEKGDRVGIWSANRFEWVLIQYATARIGTILVNINPAYRTNELEFALNQSEVNFLLAAKGFRATDYIAMLEIVRPKCPSLKQVLIIDHDWEQLLEAGQDIGEDILTMVEKTLQFDDPINIQYTSGTTGFPKGATLSHHNILNNGYFIGQTLKYTQNDRVCIPVPFYHCFGMVLGNLACTTHGAAMVIPGEAFDPELVLKTVEKEKCTSLYGVPTMFIAELDHTNFSKYDYSSLRTGIMAGSPCPVEVMKKVQSAMNMKEVTICYGMTETSPVSTQSQTDDELKKRVSTVGRVHPHQEIKIIDPKNGAILPRGIQGELCTRGYSVMLGYWNNQEATRQVIDAGRWMHTGDLAVMDDQGYISIVGRIKDVIIRGGENISPREIEEFLYSHPDISDVQVIGVPSEKYGEEVMAWVKLKEQASVTGEALYAYCKGKIATFKIPKYWKFVDGFPMTVTGKVRKVEMREISLKELNLDQVAKIKTA
ncbi:MAG: AMP-binding protein [Candidatus Cyclobacteriaceae bacterium M3_2C_046]